MTIPARWAWSAPSWVRTRTDTSNDVPVGASQLRFIRPLPRT